MRVKAENFTLIVAAATALAIGLMLLGIANLYGDGMKFPPYWREYWDYHQIAIPYVDETFGGFVKWDSLWYLQIAEKGYFSRESLAFAPLFPYLIRLVNLVMGNLVLSGFFVSFVCFGLFLLVLSRWLHSESGTASPHVTLILILTFPFSFFLYLPYSESVSLFLTTSAFYVYKRRRYTLAIFLALLSALARYIGVLVLLSFLFDVGWKSVRKREGDDCLQRLWLTVSALALLLSFLKRIGYLDWPTQEAIVNYWNLRFVPFFYSLFFILWENLREFFLFSFELLLLAIFSTYLSLKSAKKLGPLYSFYVFSNLYIIFSKGDRGLPFSLSLGRYLLPILPIFLAAGNFFSVRRKWLAPYLLVSLFFLGVNWTLFLVNYFVG